MEEIGFNLKTQQFEALPKQDEKDAKPTQLPSKPRVAASSCVGCGGERDRAGNEYCIDCDPYKEEPEDPNLCKECGEECDEEECNEFGWCGECQSQE